MGFIDLSKIYQLIQPIVESLGCELVDVQHVSEMGRRILRVLVDKPGRVTVGDCQSISREIETLLEVENVMTDRYDLEVSSPGIERPLVKKEDYQRFIGKLISLKTKEPIEGRRNYKGILKDFILDSESSSNDSGMIHMIIDGKEYVVPFEIVQKAHLALA